MDTVGAFFKENWLNWIIWNLILIRQNLFSLKQSVDTVETFINDSFNMKEGTDIKFLDLILDERYHGQTILTI